MEEERRQFGGILVSMLNDRQALSEIQDSAHSVRGVPVAVGKELYTTSEGRLVPGTVAK